MAKAEREARERAALTEEITATVEMRVDAHLRALEEMVAMASQGNVQMQSSPAANRKSSQASVPGGEVDRTVSYHVDEILVIIF